MSVSMSSLYALDSRSCYCFIYISGLLVSGTGPVMLYYVYANVRKLRKVFPF